MLGHDIWIRFREHRFAPHLGLPRFLLVGFSSPMPISKSLCLCLSVARVCGCKAKPHGKPCPEFGGGSPNNRQRTPKRSPSDTSSQRWPGPTQVHPRRSAQQNFRLPMEKSFEEYSKPTHLRRLWRSTSKLPSPFETWLVPPK